MQQRQLAYTAEGRLVPRRDPGAVLHDPHAIADRIVQAITTGRITAIDGSQVPINGESICVHGDTPGAVAVARAVRSRLVEAGVTIGSFVPDS